MIDIFSYTNYRTFLFDFCEEEKKTKSFFSYRYVGLKAGLKSPSFLSWVIKGNRNITVSLALRIARVLKLKKREADYFLLLVNHNQATDTDDRQHYLDKLIGYRGVSARILNRDAEQFYTQWYYSAIRELVAVTRITSESDVVDVLIPAIKKSEATEALLLLTRLGMIRKLESGKYERVESTLIAGTSIDAAVIHGYQNATMELGKGALHRFPKEDRDISTVTFSCDQKSYLRISERVAQMRLEIAEMAAQSKNAEQIFQLNVQMFPLSKRVAGGAL